MTPEEQAAEAAYQEWLAQRGNVKYLAAVHFGFIEGFKVATAAVDYLKAAMGEEWQNQMHGWYCPECSASRDTGHSRQCSRGRFFAAVRQPA